MGTKRCQTSPTCSIGCPSPSPLARSRAPVLSHAKDARRSPLPGPHRGTTHSIHYWVRSPTGLLHRVPSEKIAPHSRGRLSLKLDAVGISLVPKDKVTQVARQSRRAHVLQRSGWRTLGCRRPQSRRADAGSPPVSCPSVPNQAFLCVAKVKCATQTTARGRNQSSVLEHCPAPPKLRNGRTLYRCCSVTSGKTTTV